MKLKARDLILGWPWPRSFTVQPAWNPGASFNVAYHFNQAAGLEDFRDLPEAMERLRLSIHRATGKRHVQWDGEVVTEHGYPSGIDIIRAGLCGISADSPAACMFCPFVHMMECHFPRKCLQAKCSHLSRYDVEPDVNGAGLSESGLWEQPLPGDKP